MIEGDRITRNTQNIEDAAEQIVQPRQQSNLCCHHIAQVFYTELKWVTRSCLVVKY